jgi:hypothetical protein
MMQTRQSILKHNSEGARVERPRGAKASNGWLTRIFGCWHREMSRPFTRDGQAHRVCLECGAQRRFNVETWEMVGSYYYDKPAAKNLSQATVRPKRMPVVMFRAAA